MKRIEAIIKEDKLSSVVVALKEVGVGGLTVTRSQGRGAGERPQIRAARGTATFTAEFNNTCTIITVVDDSKLDAVVSSIISAAKTGSKGDGKIFVSTIDEAYDIGSAEKGSVVI